MTRRTLLGSAAVAGLLAGLVLAGPAELAAGSPMRTRFDRPGVPELLRAPSPGVAAIERQCLLCHDMPIILGQRLTEKQWRATVHKMREKFHAPLAAGSDDEAQIITLLAAALPPELPPAAPLFVQPPAGPEAVPSFAAVAGPFGKSEATRGATRYATTCAPCHGTDALGGPGAPRLIGRAILADPIGFQLLLAVGRGAMPPFADPDSRAALELLAHLRARTAAARRP